MILLPFIAIPIILPSLSKTAIWIPLELYFYICPCNLSHSYNRPLSSTHRCFPRNFVSVYKKQSGGIETFAFIIFSKNINSFFTKKVSYYTICFLFLMPSSAVHFSDVFQHQLLQTDAGFKKLRCLFITKHKRQKSLFYLSVLRTERLLINKTFH